MVEVEAQASEVHAHLGWSKLTGLHREVSACQQGDGTISHEVLSAMLGDLLNCSEVLVSPQLERKSV
jgi:hypothetical protein